jgi:hypothetical protein
VQTQSYSSPAKASALQAIDQLVVTKAGYVKKEVDIADYKSTINVQLDKASSSGRTTDGLLALYTFKEGSGNTVNDVSGVGDALNLSITNNSKNEITWIDGSGIRTDPSGFQYEKSSMDGQVASTEAASKITDAIKSSKKFSVELWVKIPPEKQTGPVRMASISASTGKRNFTIGQSDTAFDVRVRTTKINSNGLPSSRTVGTWNLTKDHITHIVFAYSNPGGKLYVDKEVIPTKFFEGSTTCTNNTLCGDPTNWDSSYKLILGNEFGGERAWKGDIYLVAFYDRPLTEQEVQEHFAAGY